MITFPKHFGQKAYSILFFIAFPSWNIVTNEDAGILRDYINIWKNLRILTILFCNWNIANGWKNQN
jgi:hypothetical protein